MIDFLGLKAVIWDMDGVVLDSEPVHYLTYQIILEKYKITSSDERAKQSYGMTDHQTIQYITDKVLPDDVVDKIVDEKNVLFKQIITEKAVFLPGVQKWMELFKQNGIRQALASSSSQENIDLILEKLGTHIYLDEVVSGAYLPSKPEPFIFLHAAERLGVSPLTCLVIEDAVAGIQAAKAAGMKCIAVSTTNPANKLGDADLVIGNLAQLMMPQIQSLFQLAGDIS